MSTSFTSLFTPISSTRILPRLAINLDGLDKCGKTHYAIYTTPGPKVVVTNDFGTELVLRKAHARGIDIAGVMRLEYPEPDPSKTNTKDNKADKEVQEAHTVWRKEWDKLKRGTDEIVKNKKIRTVIYDTGSGMYKLCRLSLFGKSKAIPKEMFDRVDQQMYELFWSLYKQREDLNIVMIHHLKKSYIGDNWSGKYERDGWNKIGAAADLTLRAGWDSNKRCFYTEVPEGDLATRAGGELVGRRFEGEENHFGYLGMAAFPETELEPEVWGL